MRADCPHCETRYNLPDKYSGKKLRCKECGKPFEASGTVDLPEEDMEFVSAEAIDEEIASEETVDMAPDSADAEEASLPGPPSAPPGPSRRPSKPAAMKSRKKTGPREKETDSPRRSKAKKTGAGKGFAIAAGLAALGLAAAGFFSLQYFGAEETNAILQDQVKTLKDDRKSLNGKLADASSRAESLAATVGELRDEEFLYRDDFINPILEDRWDMDGGKMRTRKGRLEFKSDKSANLLCKVGIPSDAVIEFDCMIKPLEPGGRLSDLSFLVRAETGVPVRSGYFIGYGSEGNTCNKIFRDGKEVSRVEASPLVPGKKWHIRLVTEGGHIRLYARKGDNAAETLEMEFKDPDPLVGEGNRFFGFYTWQSLVTVDNLRVRKP
jgi:predicted Zn finger-like uncharacterized protein